MKVIIRVLVLFAALEAMVPAVGGYSNLAAAGTKSNPKSKTVGIATKVNGWVFLKGKSGLKPVKVGDGFFPNTEILVEKEGLLEVTDIFGNHHHFVGAQSTTSAEILENGTIHLFSGWLEQISNGEQAAQVETPFLSSRTKGKQLVWVGDEKTQLLALKGEASAWHPQVIETVQNIPESQYTEQSMDLDYLQPVKPMDPQEKIAEKFAFKFREIYEKAEILKKPEVVERGSRSAASIAESGSEDIVELMQARLEGRNIDEDAPSDNVTGRWKHTRSKKKGFSISAEGKDLDSEQRELVRKIKSLVQ
ncbi:MAG: hypothetical protein AB7F43_10525 [Bacteriovoracia bacterium]